MAQWILKANGNVVPRRTLRPLKTEELYSETEAKKCKTFDALIERRWGTSINPPKVEKKNADNDDDDDTFEEYEDDIEQPRLIPDIEDAVDANGRLLNQQPVYHDKLLNAEVRLNLGDDIASGMERRRAAGADGKAIGTYDDNPTLKTMVYDIEFSDHERDHSNTNVNHRAGQARP